MVVALLVAMRLKQTTLAEPGAQGERAAALRSAVGVAPSSIVDEPEVWR